MPLRLPLAVLLRPFLPLQFLLLVFFLVLLLLIFLLILRIESESVFQRKFKEFFEDREVNKKAIEKINELITTIFDPNCYYNTFTFLGYDVTTNFSLDAGETRSLSVPVDLFDLDGQGHGFLRTDVRIYTPDREQLGTTGFATDIRGRPWSTMGLFAVLLLAITVGTAAVNFVALSRRRLPANAFTRGLRFAITGLGFGLLLAVAFSVLRIFPLPSTSWVPMVLIPTLVGFALGYLSPGPELDDDDTDDDLLDLTDDVDLDLRATTVTDA